MASSRCNPHSDTAKKEQIVTEFFAKSLHIILEARSPFVSSRNYSGEQTASSPSSSSSSSSSYRPRDQWFNLALQDCPAALENIDFWRQSNLEPMIIDVILVDRPLDDERANAFPKGPLFRSPSAKDQEEYRLEKKHEKLIERWVVKYENGRSRDSTSGCKRSGVNLHVFYKKLLVLLRSLYSTVRLLPAYKLFRSIISSGQIQAFTLTHRLRSFMEPFTRREEADMQQFGFTPIDSSCDRLSISVSYQPSLSDLSSEPSTPMSPQFIPDFFGRPLADPLKRFPSLPVSQSSPSYSQITRHRSWSFDIFRASPPSNFPSPFPAYPDFPASVSKTLHPRPMSLPPHLPDAFHANYGNMGFDEDWPSPAFLTSRSMSPPTHLSHNNPPQALLRRESAPVSIPSAKQPVTLGSPLKQCLPPSPQVRQMRPGNVKNDKSSGTSGSVAEKSSGRRDESGRLSGEGLPSNSSSRVSSSRSSCRLEYDDLELACPFVVDEDDMMNPIDSYQKSCLRESPNEAGGGLRKSPNAAVGALVLMLNKALPLHQDLSSSSSLYLSAASNPEGSSNTIQDCHEMSVEEQAQAAAAASSVVCTGQLMSKALALEELRGYRKMKECLLRQESQSRPVLDKDKDTSAEAYFN
ncbi:hypothetical protein Dimus_017702 [Dionaea muscipula]